MVAGSLGQTEPKYWFTFTRNMLKSHQNTNTNCPETLEQKLPKYLRIYKSQACARFDSRRASIEVLLISPPPSVVFAQKSIAALCEATEYLTQHNTMYSTHSLNDARQEVYFFSPTILQDGCGVILSLRPDFVLQPPKSGFNTVQVRTHCFSRQAHGATLGRIFFGC